MGCHCNISLTGEKVEVLDECRYIGVKFRVDGSRKAEVENIVLQERKIGGAQMNGNKLRIEVGRSLHEGVFAPALIYGCETQVYIYQDRSKVRKEMNNLYSICPNNYICM